jgi:hypothetical protein
MSMDLCMRLRREAAVKVDETPAHTPVTKPGARVSI